jgi:hypothetical protein
VSGWAEVSLAIIALATLTTAIIQVGVLVAAGRLARRLERLTARLEEELKPLFAHANAIGRDASRAAALATAQVERADQVFADFAQRLDDTMTTLQQVMGRPVREGAALLAAVRAALGAIRDLRTGRSRSRSRAEDEEALFI